MGIRHEQVRDELKCTETIDRYVPKYKLKPNILPFFADMDPYSRRLSCIRDSAAEELPSY